MTSTQHVRVEGTSYQRGQQYGTQARSRVRLSVQAYQQAFAHFAGWDWADGPARGRPVRGADRQVPARVPGGDARHRGRRRPRPDRRAGDQRAHRGDVLG